MGALYRYGIVAKEMAEDAATKAKASAEDLRILQKGTRKEDIDAARAAVEAQQRRLDTLHETARGDATSSRPFSGVVQSFGLRAGDIVAPNQTVAEILEVEPALGARLRAGDGAWPGPGRTDRAHVQIDTFPTKRSPGTSPRSVDQGEYTPRNVQTRAQRAEQVFGVKVLVDPNPKLKAGMAASVDLGVKGRPE